MIYFELNQLSGCFAAMINFEMQKLENSPQKLPKKNNTGKHQISACEKLKSAKSLTSNIERMWKAHGSDLGWYFVFQFRFAFFSYNFMDLHLLTPTVRPM